MKALVLILAGMAFVVTGCSQSKSTNTGSTATTQTTEIVVDSSEWNKLTPEEERVIVYKGTEYPGTGKYVKNHAEGMYICKRCNAPLFESNSKFDSGTGWPSFDDCVEGAVEEVLDADGHREEIVCNNCKGHLGHVFYGEGFTRKNTRHCVNSVSLNFVPEGEAEHKDE